MTEDHFPPLPAREQKNSDHEQEKDEADREDCSTPLLKAASPVVDLDQHDERVAACMPPHVCQVADTPIAYDVGQAGQRS